MIYGVGCHGSRARTQNLVAAHKRKNAHITNYSTNKKSSKFVENVDCSNASSGSKWSLQAFRRYLREVRASRSLPGMHD